MNNQRNDENFCGAKFDDTFHLLSQERSGGFSNTCNKSSKRELQKDRYMHFL
jgi:hypothetical protein